MVEKCEGRINSNSFKPNSELGQLNRHRIYIDSVEAVLGKAPRLDYLRARWDKLVSIVDASTAHFDAIEAGVPDGGAILVRPDGFIGLRAAPADETTMGALDAHLTTYLVPEVASFR